MSARPDGPPTATDAPVVGLVVNPHAARDVRRLVSPASSLTNHERVNLVRRLLIGLRAANVRSVLYMPDRYGIVPQALDSVPDLLARPALEHIGDTPWDTLHAARAMAAAGARVLVTHGGDGTNRLVALGADEVPLLPIAAGTNNVFPLPVEPTAAGFAAGALAAVPHSEMERAGCIRRHKRIVVSAMEQREVALVDAALVRDTALGGRAVWDPRHLSAFMVTRATPGCVGLSSLAGALLTVDPTEPSGAFAYLGPGGATVAALMAPGLVVPAEIRAIEKVAVGSEIRVEHARGAITLDGERAMLVHDDTVTFALEARGPWVVDVPTTLQWAQARGVFVLTD